MVQWVPEGGGWRVTRVGSGTWRESPLPLKTERRAEGSDLTCPQMPSPPLGILMPPEMNQQQSIHARPERKQKAGDPSPAFHLLLASLLMDGRVVGMKWHMEEKFFKST